MKAFAKEQRLFLLLRPNFGYRILNMGLGTIFVLYVSFMLIYSDQADVIEERGESLETVHIVSSFFFFTFRAVVSPYEVVEATVLAKLIGGKKADLLPMSLTAPKDKRTIGMRNKNPSPIPYSVYVRRVFMYMLEIMIKAVGGEGWGGVKSMIPEATIGY